MQQNAPNPADGQLRSLAFELHDMRIEDIIHHGLHEFLDDLQGKLNTIHEAIAETFFSVSQPPTVPVKARPLDGGQ